MRIIDADGHFQEKTLPWRDLRPKSFASRAPHVVKDNRGIEFIMMEGRLCPKPVGKACSFVGAQVVRDKKIRQVLFATQPFEQVHDLHLNGNVESRNRFVSNDEIRIDCERACDADALALTAGEFMWVSLDETFVQTDGLEQFLHTLLRFPASRQTKRVERFADDLPDCHPRV